MAMQTSNRRYQTRSQDCSYQLPYKHVVGWRLPVSKTPAICVYIKRTVLWVTKPNSPLLLCVYLPSNMWNIRGCVNVSRKLKLAADRGLNVLFFWRSMDCFGRAVPVALTRTLFKQRFEYRSENTAWVFLGVKAVEENSEYFDWDSHSSKQSVSVCGLGLAERWEK